MSSRGVKTSGIATAWFWLTDVSKIGCAQTNFDFDEETEILSFEFVKKISPPPPAPLRTIPAIPCAGPGPFLTRFWKGTNGLKKFFGYPTKIVERPTANKIRFEALEVGPTSTAKHVERQIAYKFRFEALESCMQGHRHG